MNDALKFTQSFDAVDWAKAFVKIAKEKGPDFATDEATMTGWFANAIMRGYDEYAERNKDADLIERHAKLLKHAEAMAGWIEANEGPFPDPIAALVNFRADFPKE